MTTVYSLIVAFTGLLLLALIGRDVWLRTLEARRRALTDTDTETLMAMGKRCQSIEDTLKVHSDRLLAQERKLPGPRRA